MITLAAFLLGALCALAGVLVGCMTQEPPPADEHVTPTPINRRAN